MYICLKLPKLVESRYDLFMTGHVKYDFNNFAILVIQ